MNKKVALHNDIVTTLSVGCNIEKLRAHYSVVNIALTPPFRTVLSFQCIQTNLSQMHNESIMNVNCDENGQWTPYSPEEFCRISNTGI